MGVIERRAREKEALRAKILEAATRLFVEEGYENVSIRKIADLIEYSPATIYLYFKDKAELIGAICEDAFGEMLETIAQARHSSPDPIQSLRAGIRAYVEFGLKHPGQYLIVFGMPVGPEQANPGCEQPMSLGLKTFGLLRDGLRASMESGAIPQGDVETAAQSTWMCIHGITTLAISARSQTCPGFPWLNIDHLVESSLDLVIAGLRNHHFAPATAQV
jgi:AcrR family transcriptional regulator